MTLTGRRVIGFNPGAAKNCLEDAYMQIFVINLEKDHQRRESIQRQLDELCLSFEFIPGILGSALSSAELGECYNDRKAQRNLCMPLVRAHLGCSLSHTKVYREIIRQNLPCTLILEDDVILPETLPVLLTDIEKAINLNRPEVVLLSPAEGIVGSTHKRPVSEAYNLIPYRRGFFTSSYIVTNMAARTLLKELYPVGDVADCWDRLKRYKVADIFVISPALITQERSIFGSSTTDDTLKALTTMKMQGCRKLKFKLRRAWSKLLDFFYGFYRRKFVSYAGLFKDECE